MAPELDFKGKRILVTGAAGFIGSNLTDILLKQGAEVIGIDNLSYGRKKNLHEALKNPNFTFYIKDIRDNNFILEICKEINIIYHEAAFTSVPLSIKKPLDCNDVNVNGTLNILNAARIRDVEKIIFASSCAVYGDNPNLPTKEDMICMPNSPYANSKLAAESYVILFHKIYGLNTISLRYFNVYGPRQKDSPYSGVISIWLGKIHRNEDLIIYGDGEQMRDFIFIKDVVAANLLAGMKKKIFGEILNIASNLPITINKLANIMRKVCGKENLKVQYTNPRLGDIEYSYGDISKAQEILNFEPKYNLESGLKEYYDWFVGRNCAG